ncbi:putative colanic acid biosynthesis acetyltransferase [Pseudomonas silesiensis]|uniref:putative colanic acid biosynthesis acetyltransferase n=1 Tax=Pseudomonas silesiensis TaxID=1853130 RepID=UPI0034D7AA98
MIIQNNNPYTSASFSLSNRIRRQFWNWTWLLFFRSSPKPFHKWRATLLKIFGAKLGKNVHVYPSVKIWAPWNLELGDHVGIADGVIVYNMDCIRIDSYTTVSQGTHLCAGSHDFNSPNFQLYTKPIIIGKNVWICADTFISLGVSIADGVVVGARSLVVKNICQPWTVHAGHPTKQIGKRKELSHD